VLLLLLLLLVVVVVVVVVVLSLLLKNRDSAMDIATGYRLDDRGDGVRVPAGSIFFSTLSRPVLGFTQPPTQCVTGAHFPGVKRPGREADHSPPTSAEVNKMRAYTSAYVFMA
jgi:hypothetical protein